MSITYEWKVTALQSTTVGDKSDYIVQTRWKKIGTDEQGNVGEFQGATPFTPDPTQSEFTPLSELTEADVLSWIQAVVVGSYAEHVDAQIARQIAAKAAPVVEQTLPWAPAAQEPVQPEVMPAD